LQAGELKAEVEAKASLAVGTCIRTLLWGSRELEGAQMLWELGMCGAEEAVAICAAAIEGEFARFRLNPDCGCMELDTSMRFELSGVASLTHCPFLSNPESRAFRYTLGEVEEGGFPGMLGRGLYLEEVDLYLEEVEHEGEPIAVFEGWVEFDATDPIQRRVSVPGLLSLGEDFEDLQDIRREKVEAQMRLQVFWRTALSNISADYSLQQFFNGEGEAVLEVEENEMLALRSVFARHRCQQEGFRRERRPKSKRSRRNHCCCGLACPLVRRDARAAAALVRSRTRRAERELKMAV